MGHEIKLAVVVEKGDHNYSAYSPDLPVSSRTPARSIRRLSSLPTPRGRDPFSDRDLEWAASPSSVGRLTK